MTDLFAFVFLLHKSLILYFYNGYYCSLKLTFNKKRLVIFHFIIHTVNQYMCTYYLNHILMFYIFKRNEKRVVLYFEENEKAVVFDIISFYCNACTRCINHIFVAINILNETEKRQRCLI